MTRLPILDDFQQALNFSNDPAENRLRSSDNLDEYSTFTPLHYEKNHQYPLLIWLHGPGDDENQLRTIMPLLSMRNFVAVGPRGTKFQQESFSDTPTYTWQQTDEQIELASEQVFHCIEQVQKSLSINPQRIIIGGLRSGGTMALRIAMNHPELFAGVMTVGGRVPQGQSPFRCLHELRRLPILIANGMQSELYPEKDLCADLRLLHSAGLGVSLRLYPCQDELMTNMLEDLNRWMMQQLFPEQWQETPATFEAT